MLTRFIALIGGAIYLAALVTLCSHFSKGSSHEHWETPQIITSYLDEWTAKQGFNGVILLRHNNKPLLSVAYGVADASASKPLTQDTIFQTNSIGKWFASIAVFVLIEDDILALDAPIGIYVDCLPPAIGSKVTLHHWWQTPDIGKANGANTFLYNLNEVQRYAINGER